MKKKIILGILALTLAFSVTACGDDKKSGAKEASGKEEQKEIVAERGTFEGNVYTNKSMGIQVTFPEDCTMYSDEQIEQLVGAGAEVMEEAYDSDSVEKGLSGTIYDVVAVTADQAANIQVVMEDTKSTAGKVLSSKEYAEVMVKNLETTYSSAGIETGEPERSEETYGGVEFSTVYLPVNGMIQKYAVCQVENYVLVFTFTYADSAEDTIQQFLDSVKAI